MVMCTKCGLVFFYRNKTDLNAVFDGLTSGQTYQITVLTWAGQEKSDPRADVFWTGILLCHP